MSDSRQPGDEHLKSDSRPTGQRVTATPGPPLMLPESSELEALRAIVKGTARETGEAFFQALVASLAQAICVEFAFIAEFVEGQSKVRTRAFWARDQIVPNVEYELAGTPCQDVLTGKLCHHPQGIQRTFPLDEGLVQLHVESYLGVPLRDRDGNVLGHLAVFDGKPMPAEPRSACLIEIFASRAAAELERLAMETTLAESEQRFRDLFEKAPIAYVLEDGEGRIVEANQAALELLGLATSDHEGVADLSVTVMSPASGQDAAPPASLQAALRERAQQQGCGLPEMEFRRRDDGRPVWIQGWSRPEPRGRYARIMLLDVTARVLAEQERARLEEDNRKVP